MSEPSLSIIPSEPPADGAIERLEDILKRVRAGEISSVAIAWVTREGTSGRCWSKLPSVGAMLGSISRLAYLLNQDMDE